MQVLELNFVSLCYTSSKRHTTSTCLKKCQLLFLCNLSESRKAMFWFVYIPIFLVGFKLYLLPLKAKINYNTTFTYIYWLHYFFQFLGLLATFWNAIFMFCRGWKIFRIYVWCFSTFLKCPFKGNLYFVSKYILIEKQFKMQLAFQFGVFHILCHRLRERGVSEILVTLLNKLI